ncbi:MAG: polymer-forming cytoskeletal protein [Myxococcota bacterium]
MDNGTLISSGTVVNGTVRGKGVLAVGGRVEGKIAIDGEVEILAKGFGGSEIEADLVRVRGAVKGTVRARVAAALDAGSVVEGDIHAPRIDIDPQSRIKARLHMPLTLPRGVRVPPPAARREDPWNS